MAKESPPLASGTSRGAASSGRIDNGAVAPATHRAACSSRAGSRAIESVDRQPVSPSRGTPGRYIAERPASQRSSRPSITAVLQPLKGTTSVSESDASATTLTGEWALAASRRPPIVTTADWCSNAAAGPSGS
ncbi:MAG: hypothetical protein ISS73_05090 [Pirellulales bacterium]|nr:hypothetical protein [Pirellulales bacterium]